MDVGQAFVCTLESLNMFDNWYKESKENPHNGWSYDVLIFLIVIGTAWVFTRWLLLVIKYL